MLSAGSRSRAVATARRIERDILGQSLTHGVVLGSCTKLALQYGVGERSMREAVRIVELLGWARMRRGPNGGLVVARQPLSVAARRIRGKLQLIGGPAAMAAARPTITRAIARLAGRRPGDAAVELDRWLHDHPIGPDRGGRRECNAVGFPIALAAASGNFVAEFIASITALGLMDAPWFAPSTLAEWSATCEREVLAALRREDLRGVEQTLGLFLSRLGDAAARHAPGSDDPEDVICRTRAGQVARSIAMESVGRRDATASGALGTIGGLCSARGISRTTAIQALRILEASEMVSVKRGRGQGYFLKPLKPEDVACQLSEDLEARPRAAIAAKEVLDALIDASGALGGPQNIVIETLMSALRATAGGAAAPDHR